MLVRGLKGFKALYWLKLNHVDYYDCEISDKTLASYPEDSLPVVVDYHSSMSNKNPEFTSINDMDGEDGTSEGPCFFVVYGLTGDEFSTKTMKTIKSMALQHMTSERRNTCIQRHQSPFMQIHSCSLQCYIGCSHMV